MNRLSLQYKLWFSGEEQNSAFGDGKCILLKAIKSEGSLSAAAKKLNISYRKAWGDLKKAEAGLNVQLIDKTRGGKNGGKSMLTPDGERIIAAYTNFREDAMRGLDESFKKFLAEFEPDMKKGL